ncbi:MAG: ferric reductase-like transmembrane domain-containing protein [Chryseolinea sp.]
MSASYQSILWNRQKRIYDFVLIGFVLTYLVIFVLGMLIVNPQVTQETMIIRSTSTLALLLLHVILSIGPLARINKVFLPILYNRRHLGVTMFFVAAVHGVFSIMQFHALGNVNPIISVFTSNQHYESFSKFPFEIFGFFALIIFFLMAITSHDFWLHNLGRRTWKALHMLVYVAYTFIILHVLLGALQDETSPALIAILGVGASSIIALHIISGHQEHKKDKEKHLFQSGFLKVCHVDAIPENRARVLIANGERVAVYKYDRKISAVSNVCKHQLGPLGEGKIIDGCITCPWHGYQYLPLNGTSPPPFKEKVATYDVKVLNNEVWVNPIPYEEGTARMPAEF